MKMPLFILLLVFGACQQAQPVTDAGPVGVKAVSAIPPPHFKWAFYDYGELLPAEMAEAREEVWAKYGVQTANFGCEVTKKLLRDIKLHNDSLFALLQTKYPGLNEDRINREIAAYENRNKKN